MEAKVLIEKYKENNIFYVYAYLDPRKPGKHTYGEYSFDYEPFYIGKGHKERSGDHIIEAENILNKGMIINKKNFPNINLHKTNKILRIIKEKQSPIILKLNFNMTEQESFKLETKCIKIIGRNDLNKGPLTNLTDGGEGSSGIVISEETREKLRKAQTGKKLSNETKKKISSIHIGKKQSKETIRKRIKKGEEHYLFGKHLSEETKNKISIKTSGKNNPNYGKVASIETREKISLKNSGKSMKTKLLNLYGEEIGMQKLTEMISRNNKSVLQYSLNGDFIDMYKSISEAGRILNISNSNINSCVNRRTKTAGNFMWMYYDGEKIHKKIISVHFDENIHRKKVIQYDLQMNKINEFESTLDAMRKLKIDSSGISKACRGIAEIAGGFMWRYVDCENIITKFKKITKGVIQYDIQMNKINGFKSIKNAETETNVGSSGITKVCKNKQKTAGGFIWKYADAA